MAKGDPQIVVRVTPELKGWLEETAKRNLRSTNSEILLAIREKMERSTGENPA